MLVEYELENPAATAAAAAAAAAAMLLFGEESAADHPHYADHFLEQPQHVFFSDPNPYSCSYGLGLGERTYFPLAVEAVPKRAACRRRTRTARCQVDRCGAELTYAKHYHRRHKVCEYHSKASVVVAAGLAQRFCQQCSRFHVLAEFDHGKRSCRRRLAEHNRRRRKPQVDPSTIKDYSRTNNNNSSLTALLLGDATAPTAPSTASSSTEHCFVGWNNGAHVPN